VIPAISSVISGSVLTYRRWVSIPSLASFSGTG